MSRDYKILKLEKATQPLYVRRKFSHDEEVYEDKVEWLLFYIETGYESVICVRAVSIDELYGGSFTIQDTSDYQITTEKLQLDAGDF